MKEEKCLIIEVTGINQITTKETLDSYFSSSRRGGDITNIDYVQGNGYALVTFADEEGAKTALEKGSHCVDGCILITRRKMAEISENDKVLVQGISTKTTKDCLRFYMERISDLDVKDITYGPESDETVNAIVTFGSPIDFDKIQEAFNKKPTLEGKIISIKTVPLCKTILVKNLPITATSDSVCLNFESKRAGGAEVETVHLDEEKKIALVELKYPKVIDKVLSLKQTLDNTTLSVERFYPILGSLDDIKTTEQDSTDSPCCEVPKPNPPKTKPKPPKIQPKPKIKTNDETYCNEHLGMKLNFYCETCDKLICDDCMDFKHVKQEDHSCSLVKDVANKYKELLASNNKAMEVALTQGNIFLERLRLMTKQIDFDAETIKSEIMEGKEFVEKKVSEILSQKAKTLLNKVDEISQEANLNRQTEETNKFVESIKTSVQLSKKLVDQGTEEEIISSQKMMLDNANNLLAKREEYFKASIPLAKLSYTGGTDKEPIDEDILRELEKSLGQVNEENTEKGPTAADDTPEAGGTELNAIADRPCLNLDLKTTLGTSFKEIPLKPNDDLRSFPFSSTDQLDAKSAATDQSDTSSTATDQLPQSKKPDDMFTLHTLFLRHVLAHHYDVFQKLQNVSREISFEIKSDTETNLKIFPRNDVDKPTFSKSTDEFIKFYQTQNQKMHLEVIPILPEYTKDVISEACKKFSVTNDLTQDPDEITIYGEKENVENTKRFLKDKVADHSPGCEPSEETTEEVDGNEKLSFDFSENLKLVVYQGDLTKENADAIVAPANDRLQHKDDEAEAIVKAGGRSIQEEIVIIMWKKGNQPFQAGEVIATGGGQLLCKFLVHAICPVWSHYAPNTAKQMLNNAVTNSLDLACRYNATSISMPAIGAGLPQVPINICAEVLFEAVENFASHAEKMSSLREIRFVNFDKPTNRVFVQEMEKRFPGSVTREKIEVFLPSDTKKHERQTQITSIPDSDHDQTTISSFIYGTHCPRRDENENEARFSLDSYAAAAEELFNTDIDPTSGSYGKKTNDDECAICLNKFTKKKTLRKCGHSFCTKCIDRAFQTQKQCPLCFTVYGPLKGNQPEGNMFDSFQSSSLPGFGSCGTIVISYRFPSGIQGPDHPNPGKLYTGTSRTAYLPDNKKGKKVLKLLRKAFEKKLLFTIGQSQTTGIDNCVTWNDIPHKSSMTGGPTCYGYPDPDYLKTVTDKLAAKGITE